MIAGLYELTVRCDVPACTYHSANFSGPSRWGAITKARSLGWSLDLRRDKARCPYHRGAPLDRPSPRLELGKGLRIAFRGPDLKRIHATVTRLFGHADAVVRADDGTLWHVRPYDTFYPLPRKNEHARDA